MLCVGSTGAGGEVTPDSTEETCIIRGAAAAEPELSVGEGAGCRSSPLLPQVSVLSFLLVPRPRAARQLRCHATSAGISSGSGSKPRAAPLMSLHVPFQPRPRGGLQVPCLNGLAHSRTKDHLLLLPSELSLEFLKSIRPLL